MICTLKEQMQGLLATLPFSNIPKQMKIEFIYLIVLWLNAFLVKTGILTTYSLRELLIRWQLDYKEALSGAARVVLRGPLQAGPNKYDGMANAQRDHTWPDWQSTRQN
jgi:hypothetical protein